MNYSWDLNELKRKEFITRFFTNKKWNILYNELITVLSDTYTTEDIDLRTNETLDLDRCSSYFTKAIDYIPENLYSDLTDIFTWFYDYECLGYDPKFSKLDISNDDLISIVHDIIKTFDNKQMEDEYFKLIKNNKINIIKSDERNKTNSERLGGFNSNVSIFKDSYINIFRNYTVEDIDILFHEYMHAYFFQIDKRNRNTFQLLPELEGQFGSQYAVKYLENNHFNDTDLLKLVNNNNIIASSFMMLINHVLFVNFYDLDKTNEYLDKSCPDLNVIVLEEELKDYLVINGFQTLSNMISYLSILDLMKKYDDPKELFKVVSSIKLNDDEAILENLYKHPDITFYQDGYTNFINEYKLTHKKEH